MQIHFFTIVLNGMPFIQYHIKAFNKLNLDWHWHIIEGLASHQHDTAWCAKNGGTTDSPIHKNGLSNDGTTEYLDQLKAQFPDRISIYRKGNGLAWNGKLEMVSAPIPNLPDECLLWQIDSDELWTSEQIATTLDLFMKNPESTAAFFKCLYFFGPDIASSAADVFGNFTKYEWLRVWKYQKGDLWKAHEPPTLSRKSTNGEYLDIGRINPIMHATTEKAGLVFQHYAYAIEAQVAFKEIYYGYKGAVEAWRKLQQPKAREKLVRKYLRWVMETEVRKPHKIKSKLREFFRPSPGARAEDVKGIKLLATHNPDGSWSF